MYLVIQQGQVVKQFPLFVDAWLYLYLSDCWGQVVGPDGTWKVNPATPN